MSGGERLGRRWTRVGQRATIGLFALLVIATSAPGPSPALASESLRAFFPSRPADATPLSATGVLDDYGIGNGSGAVTLRQGSRRRSFYAAANVKLDGRAVACDFPPRAGRPKSPFCTYWPRAVVLGRSRVRVDYWRMRRPGSAGLVDVTDGIHTL